MIGTIQFRFIASSVLVVVGVLVAVVGSQAGTVSGEPIDSDGDGFSDADEEFIGTDPFDDCADVPVDDAWPPDLNNDQRVNLMDILKFKGLLNDEAKYKPRYDLYMPGYMLGQEDKNKINILDVAALLREAEGVALEGRAAEPEGTES